VTTSPSSALAASAWTAFRGNRGLVVFPLLGFVLSVGALIALGVAALLAYAADQTVPAVLLGIAAVVVSQTLLTLCAGGLTAAADATLRGEPAGLGFGLRRALGRGASLTGWAVIGVGVGAVIGAIRGNGNNSVAARVGRDLAAGAVSTAWRVLTYLVLPVIMIEGSWPPAAVRRSTSLVRARWGAQIKGIARLSVGTTLRFFLPGVLAILGAAGILVLNPPEDPAGLLRGIGLLAGVLGAVGLLLLVIGGVISAVLRSLFQVALYRYASGDDTTGPFAADDLAAALTPR